MVLYLIPTSLGETDLDRILPAYNNEIVNRLDFFIVEDVRTARRFLKKINPATDIDSKTFYVLNQHTRPEEIAGFLKPLSEGREVGVISEAGCPAIADPGADVVAIAQERGFKVVPLVGPSSILLALMASGFNGQSFAFNGYLPVQPADRTKAIKRLENRAHNEKQSQIFIETPYRNIKMLQDIISVCQPSTRLCIAADITLETEFIRTKTVSNWKNQLPDLNKRPCIFILY
ncbi:MAG: SAM-dependent methyltransferase [Paludibacteraceae bacterium]|nr:SAM-dependent methyltransferase [Paludibacteraceae bacterium]